MNPFTSSFHIFLGILAYFVVAGVAAALVKKRGNNLKETTARTQTSLLFIGGAANLVVLVIVMLLVVGVNHVPLAGIGLSFSWHDFLFSLVGLAATFLLAVGFVRIRRREQTPPAAKTSVIAAVGTRQFFLGTFVLLLVAVQEELLYRGYITLNLDGLSSAWILIITTAIFVLIHFFTNHVDRFQTVSWTVSGLVLAGAYLISGSIWVPIILHLGTDMINVLVFDITGQQEASMAFAPMTAQDRAAFRVLYGAVSLLLLVVFYGLATPGLL
jgi:membrane protease YdiL (CAAX protease family)